MSITLRSYSTYQWTKETAENLQKIYQKPSSGWMEKIQKISKIFLSTLYFLAVFLLDAGLSGAAFLYQKISPRKIKKNKTDQPQLLSKKELEMEQIYLKSLGQNVLKLKAEEPKHAAQVRAEAVQKALNLIPPASKELWLERLKNPLDENVHSWITKCTIFYYVLLLKRDPTFKVSPDAQQRNLRDLANRFKNFPEEIQMNIALQQLLPKEIWDKAHSSFNQESPIPDAEAQEAWMNDFQKVQSACKENPVHQYYVKNHLKNLK